MVTEVRVGREVSREDWRERTRGGQRVRVARGEGEGRSE